MRGFGDRPGSVSERQLLLAAAESPVEFVDGTIADELTDAVVIDGAVGVG